MLIGHRVLLAAAAMAGALPLLLMFRAPRPFVTGLVLTACTAVAGSMALCVGA